MTMFEIIISGLIVEILHDLIKHAISVFTSTRES